MQGAALSECQPDRRTPRPPSYLHPLLSGWTTRAQRGSSPSRRPRQLRQQPHRPLRRPRLRQWPLLHHHRGQPRWSPRPLRHHHHRPRRYRARVDAVETSLPATSCSVSPEETPTFGMAAARPQVAIPGPRAPAASPRPRGSGNSSEEPGMAMAGTRMPPMPLSTSKTPRPESSGRTGEVAGTGRPANPPTGEHLLGFPYRRRVCYSGAC